MVVSPAHEAAIAETEAPGVLQRYGTTEYEMRVSASVAAAEEDANPEFKTIASLTTALLPSALRFYVLDGPKPMSEWLELAVMSFDDSSGCP